MRYNLFFNENKLMFCLGSLSGCDNKGCYCRVQFTPKCCGWQGLNFSTAGYDGFTEQNRRVHTEFMLN
jgi:hypothetical protein